MSMSTHVIGFSPPDEHWQRMKAAYDACLAVGIDPPAEVEKFFNYESPDPAGVEVDLRKHPAVKEYKAEMVSGYEVDLSKLPPGVKIIRFTNHW